MKDIMKVEFDINKFAEEFKNTINWMLSDNSTPKKDLKNPKDDLKDFEENKIALQNDPDSLRALRVIIELIKTNGWHLKLSRNFNNKWDSFMNKHGKNFRTPEAKEELIRLVGTRKKKSIELLLQYPTIKDFTENLYRLAKEGKTEVLGEKGRDNYLRDFGYYDRIPIDVHEMRFIIRTGIYHACSSINMSDCLKKSDLQDALRRFCNNHLKGFMVEGIDLGNMPGITDLFIWSFCAEDRYNICGTTPKCEICKLKNVCLYALTNLSQK